MNNEKLRQKDEFVKHKILDFIGDIYLLGYPVKGAFEIYKGGHRLTHELMNSLMSDNSNWTFTSDDDFQDQQLNNSYYTKALTVSL